MKRLIKTLVILIVAAGLVTAGVLLWRRNGAEAKADEETIPTAKVTRGPLRLTVESTGSVEANLDVEIKCKASGEIVKLPFEVSDTVKKGDLLVELDPTDEERRVRQEQISLKASEAKLAQAKLNLTVAERNLATERLRAESALRSAEASATEAKAKANRIKTLLEKNIASPEEYDTAQTNAVQAEAEVANAGVRIEELETEKQALDLKRQDVALAATAVELDQVDLELAQQSLADTKVIAPMAGVVTARSVQTGQIISSAISNVGGGSTVMTLSDLSRIYVKASVDESDIGQVDRQQAVVITADAFPDTRFRGEVIRIAPRGVNVSNVVTFEVTIEVTSRNKGLLKPEMTANVEIIAAEREDVLQVPVEAVRRIRSAASGTSTSAAATSAGGSDAAPAGAGRRADERDTGAGRVRPPWTRDGGDTRADRRPPRSPEQGTERRAPAAAAVERMVTVVNADGTAEDRRVEVGISDGVSIEIVKGLSEGETVQVPKGEAESRWRQTGGRRPGMFPGAPRGGRR